METKRRAGYWQTAAGLAALLLLAAGCYQPMSDQAPVATDIWSAGPTFTPPPTTEPLVLVVTPTTDPFALDQTATAQAFAAQSSSGFTDPSSAGIDFSAQATPNQFLSPDQILATQIIETAMATAAFMLTQQAISLGIGFPTATPTPTFGFPDTSVGGTGGTVGQPFVPTLPPGVDCIHEVRAGETLYRIALTYGVRMSDIAARSGVTNTNALSIGQRLTIPACGVTGYRPLPTSTTPPTATPPGTPAPAAPGVPPTAVSIPGGATSGALPPGSVVPGTTGGTTVQSTPFIPAGATTYTVQEGDTLGAIATRFGVTTQDLANANGIVNVNLIKVNDVLVIPAGGTTSGGSTFLSPTSAFPTPDLGVPPFAVTSTPDFGGGVPPAG